MPRKTVVLGAILLAALGAGIALFFTTHQATPSPTANPAANLYPTGTDAGYLDAAVCAGCHSAIAETYSRTGMARSLGAFAPGTPSAMFPEGTFEHKPSAQVFTMFRRAGKPYVKRHVAGPGGAPSEEREAEVAYWFGSGNRGRGFVHRSPSGKLTLLPVTWYAGNGGHWGMSPSYDRPVHQGFDRPINHRCMSCHAGYPELEPAADSRQAGSYYPGKIVNGIDCQRCHGPGRAHVEAIRTGQNGEAVRNAIVNPARLSAERRLEVCLQCHLETTSASVPGELIRFDRGAFSYRPGQPLGDWLIAFDYAKGAGHDGRVEFVSSAYRLFQSACFRQSRGEMTCTTCHNPHDIPRGQAAVQHYDAACRRCHAARLTDLVRARSHPDSPNCASCHMPQRTPIDAVRVRIADHFIRKRPESDPPKPLAEPAGIKPYRGVVAPFYPPRLPSTPESELYIAVAQVTQQANLQQGVPLLEQLITLHRPERGEFYLELAIGWKNLGRLDKSRQWLEEAVRRMPSNWRPLVVLANALAASGEPDRAAELLHRAATLAPREAAPLTALADVHLRRNQAPQAIEVLRQALRIQPELAEAHNTLGTTLMDAGDAAGAETSLREAVRLRPEIVHARVNLATLLALNGRRAEARHHFELALRLDDKFADAHSAYATSLAQDGLVDQARLHYQRALQLNPADAVTHYNLAAAFEQLGQPDAAIREYQAAIRYARDYHEAHLGLAQLYLGKGQRAAAAPHLHQAGASRDPEVRQQAAALLARP